MPEHRTSQRFLIELSLLNELSAYADKQDETFSDLINKAIREFLSNQ